MIEIIIPETERDNTVTKDKCPCIGVGVDDGSIEYITFSRNTFHLTNKNGETSYSDMPNWVKKNYKLAPKGTTFKFMQE